MSKIKVSEFVKLTGSTLKTVNYYHKIGLLTEPERSEAGYRLYGLAELNRMRSIKRLKSLGFDLKHIKEIIGELQEPDNSREYLESLRRDLLDEIKTLEARVAKIDILLGAGASPLEENRIEPPSFKKMAEIMGSEQVEKYSQSSPELYAQHRRLHNVIDDFQWGEDYQQTYSSLAQFFKEHPEEYRISLEYGARLSRIAELDQDDPEIDNFAREVAELINNMPILRKILLKPKPIEAPLKNVFDELVADVLPPSRIRFNQLLQKHLGLAGKPASHTRMDNEKPKEG